MKFKPLWKLFQPVPVLKYCIIYTAKIVKDLMIQDQALQRNVGFFVLMGPWKLFKIIIRCGKTCESEAARTRVSVSILAACGSQGRDFVATEEIWAAAWTKKTRAAFSTQTPNSFGGKILNSVLTRSQCRKITGCFRNVKVWCIFFSVLWFLSPYRRLLPCFPVFPL